LTSCGYEKTAIHEWAHGMHSHVLAAVELAFGKTLRSPWTSTHHSAPTRESDRPNSGQCDLQRDCLQFYYDDFSMVFQ
jgi:hypothetical protein